MTRKHVVRSVCAIDSIDWRSILAARPNILLCGERPFTDACLSALKPYCPAPLETMTRFESESLSEVHEGAVILEDINDYSRGEQREVFDWLDQADVQLITTTQRSLLNLVRRGTFIEELYYRLNVVYLDLPSAQYVMT